ncbi:acetyl-CoA C-acyltransferase [candidate division CSSED10-310 bacterium]|uniref:acetyl-CoA C-acyltransferase n=1 Tax=candidate division CSSED10-310 bacterium TaxID=2855610 RepID=A0ABV6YZA4_UNCC1
MSKSSDNVKTQRRAVIVNGVRTPFVRAFAEYMKLDAIDLGAKAVQGLLQKTGLAHHLIDALYWGGVIFPNGAPNVGREIVLDLGLPPTIDAYTVTRACSSSLLSIALAATAIERGEADVVIAGGGDSTSNAEVILPRSLMQTVAPVAMNRKAGVLDWLGVVAQLAPFTDILPQRPQVAERSTGQLMGEAAEEMAQRNNISREEQDKFTLSSHQRAAAAMASGRFANEVIPVKTASGKTVYSDTIVRGDTTLAKLGKLRPVFAKNGTLTAGNSSALTDGAAAALLMSDEKAAELGFTPLAAFKSWHWVGVDPADQLLMGPAVTMPVALKKAGLELKDIDVVDIHEAFAAQVLSVLKMLASDNFARQRLGYDQAMGEIPPEKLNIHGGSVALGHPFGATGARMVITMANELALTDKKTALLGVCAAGGLGAAAVLEAVNSSQSSS